MVARLGVVVAAACLLLGAPAAAQGVLERAAARGTLVAAAMPDTLPQSARDAEGRLVGFDIEVAAEIARRFGLDIAFVTPDWQEILAGGWARRWDLAVVSMTPTAEREAVLDFPVVYRLSPATLVVHNDNATIREPADASGRTVGVKADTTYERYLDQDLSLSGEGRPLAYLVESPVVRVFPDNRAALAALAEGDGARLDAVVTSLDQAQAAIDAGLPLKTVPGFLFFEPLAVAIDKGDPTFAAEVARVVDAMRSDGTLSRLSLTWFGLDLVE
ncbi:MAG: transporter substrate-binding domain-containing protein [Rhodospirillales bacterium]